MKTYFIDAEAAEDLDDIYDYGRKQSPTAASRLISELYETFERIANNPDMGRLYENRAPGLQVFVSGKYHVFYRIVNDDAQIKRVIHGARDLTKIVFH